MEKSQQAESEEDELARVYAYLKIASKLYKNRTNRDLVKDVINDNYFQEKGTVKSKEEYIDEDLANLVYFHLNSVMYTVELGIIDGSCIKLSVKGMPNKSEDIIDSLYNSEGILKITPQGTHSTVGVPTENITSIIVHEGDPKDDE